MFGEWRNIKNILDPISHHGELRVPKDFVWLVVCPPSIKVPIVMDCNIRISVQTRLRSSQDLPRIT